MILSLITRDRYIPMRLPDRREGVFTLRDENGGELFTVEGDGEWVVRETERGRLPKGQPVTLQPGQLVGVRIGSSMQPAYLYAEKADRWYAKYARCQMPDNGTYTVGSGRDNFFVLLNPNASLSHCRLTCRGRVWSVADMGSKLGTYVNGKRLGAGSAQLAPGDVVSVLNQKFIVLPGLLAFNAQNVDVKRLQGVLHSLKAPPLPEDKPLAPEKPTVYFHRRARFTSDVEGGKDITIAAPPAPHLPGGDDTPDYLTYGPGMVSGAAMLLGGMNPLSALAMMASPMIFRKMSRQAGEKKLQEQEAQRQKLYTEYLQKLEAEQSAQQAKQMELLRRQVPDPREEAEQLLRDKHTLWSRRPEHSDFLRLRLGIGDIPVTANITFPEKDAYGQPNDPMQEKLKALQNTPRVLKAVPITIELDLFFSVVISGSHADRSAFAAQLLGQLAMHIGYDDMKLCLLGPLPRSLAPLRWLPHTWDNGRRVHLMAESREELDRLLPALGALLENHRADQYRDRDTRDREELVILITDADLAQSGTLTRLLFDKKYEHTHVITLASQVPSLTDLAIGVRDGRGRMVWQEEQKCHRDFVPDQGLVSVLPSLAGMMANTFLDLRTASAAMPATVPFLDMFGVRDVRRLNVLDRWNHADAVHTLRAPLGVSEDGTLCTLDVHEKGDGVHGLIAGTTGAGKSELIMSYILSMAVNYSPNDVTFALIDYKGGGMANAFASLPHTVGIITNLDGNALRRTLVSITSENKRRQRVFNETQTALGMQEKLEISDYQQLYRAGKVSQPMPHLIIVTDEFAELKMQQRDFMDELISAARIGRSLGVHLILATQQPEGVVDSQIESNTNFRLCLRMASVQDSQSVLHSPAAAELQRVGSFYKQVGTVLTKAQSAYTGAAYTPDKASVPSCGVEVLDHSGAILQRQMLSAGRAMDGTTQLSAVVRHIRQIADRDGIHARPLWVPELEETIPLPELYAKYAVRTDPWVMEPVLGELDDPAAQSRALVRIPLSSGKNAIVYGGIGSGKAMLLGTVLEDLMTHHTPEQLHIYILDYADDGLYSYLPAPHVGDVLTSDDEEKLGRFLNYLRDEIRTRKKKLAGSAVPLPERLRNAGMYHILVVLHSLGNIKDQLGNDLDRFIPLLKEGPRWGISFLATQESTSGLFQLAKCFAQQYVLQMDHDDDYSTVFGASPRMVPSQVRGRGLLRVAVQAAPSEKDTGFREFQTASAEEEPAALSERLKAAWTGRSAVPIRVMPEHVTGEDLLPELDPARPLVLPVGLDPEKIEPAFYPFDSRPVHILMGRNLDTSAFLHGLLPLAQANGLEVIALDPNDVLMDLPDLDSDEDLAGRVMRLCEQWQAAKTAGDGTVSRLIVVPALRTLLKALEGDALAALRRMLEQVGPGEGATFLLCATPASFKDLRYDINESWFSSAVSGEDGLYLGGGITEQTVLHAEGDMNKLYQSISFPLGYTVRERAPRRIQFVEEGEEL